MKLTLFDYKLPRGLIAQFPTRRRDQSRLLVYNRKQADIAHHKFNSVIDYFKPGDALVVNNTRVFKARLIGQRKSGGKIEIFLVRQVADDSISWLALGNPEKRLKVGEEILFKGVSQQSDHLTIREKIEGGGLIVSFQSEKSRTRIINEYGHIPLPQYIEREDVPSDINRYQTIFAAKDQIGAVAAPTAGFHFSNSLIKKLKAIGVSILNVTLHVGPGTFKPISVDQIEDHKVDPEFAELTPDVASKLNEIKKSGGSVFAVGTTSVRTLESAQISKGQIIPFSKMVDLYVKPGYKFRLVDHMITNFHLPKSSLLVLVSAFAGREQILGCYSEAIDQEYRFYSYGDAMLIL